MICKRKRELSSVYTHVAATMSEVCSQKFNCTNHPDLEEIGCSNLSSDKTVCDGLCNDRSLGCEDESECNGYRYGVFCQPVPYYLAPIFVCDGRPQCVSDRRDEVNCREALSRKGFPSSISGKGTHERPRRVPLFNFTRCAAMSYSVVTRKLQPYCSNYVDQTNCSDTQKIAVRCNIQGYGLSTVSRIMVCGKLRVGLCADKMDMECVTPSPGCTLHKHQLCDGISDCSEGSDELLTACQATTKERCDRSYKHATELPIPLSWLGDGLKDCLSGIDEDTFHWPTCGKAETKRYTIENSVCQDLFLCKQGPVRYIIDSQLCDGINTCGNENKICKISRGISSVATAVLARKSSTNLHYCIKGLQNIQRQETPCVTEVFDIFKEDTYGMSKHMITYPQKQFDCNFFFGLAYLYLSCFGACNNTECPLTRPVTNTDCPGQFDARAYTLVNNHHLTFVIKKAGVYTNDFFTCSNNFCVEYSKVCNLIDDCGDGSDENVCSNHHQCDKNRTYISLAQTCDDKVNCKDWSDECNEQCGKEIINGLVLKVTAFAIGSIAIVLNTTVIIESCAELRKGSSKSLILINKILMTMIALGDLLIGFYLLSVAIAVVIYGSSFCKERVKWLTSRYCSALGVISTIGGQISLFSLTLLSLFRAIGIKNSLLSSNPRVGGNEAYNGIAHSSKIVMFLVMPLISVTTMVAVAPLFSSLEDFFVNGLAYDSAVKLFTEPIGKDTHFALIQAYFGRARKQTLKWSLIETLVKDMFSSDYGHLDGKIQQVHFYGNDGVCLFKYFVNYNDPQRIYSLSVQVINILCFIIVAVSYIVISTTTTQNSSTLTQANNPTAKLVRRRNKKLQKKITAIIITDFACWIPFVLVSFLHFFAVIDASKQYGLFSIVILPINSVISPFFYSNRVTMCVATLNPSSGLAAFYRFLRKIRIRQFLKRANFNDNNIKLPDIKTPNADGEMKETASPATPKIADDGIVLPEIQSTIIHESSINKKKSDYIAIHTTLKLKDDNNDNFKSLEIGTPNDGKNNNNTAMQTTRL